MTLILRIGKDSMRVVRRSRKVADNGTHLQVDVPLGTLSLGTKKLPARWSGSSTLSAAERQTLDRKLAALAKITAPRQRNEEGK